MYTCRYIADRCMSSATGAAAVALKEKAMIAAELREQVPLFTVSLLYVLRISFSFYICLGWRSVLTEKLREQVVVWGHARFKYSLLATYS